METEHRIHEDDCRLSRLNGVGDSSKMNHLTEPVDEDKNPILAVHLW